jgi:hypothetical protein
LTLAFSSRPAIEEDSDEVVRAVVVRVLLPTVELDPTK